MAQIKKIKIGLTTYDVGLLLEEIYPVGAIYVSSSGSLPANINAIGTWSALNSGSPVYVAKGDIKVETSNSNNITQIRTTSGSIGAAGTLGTDSYGNMRVDAGGGNIYYAKLSSEIAKITDAAEGIGLYMWQRTA